MWGVTLGPEAGSRQLLLQMRRCWKARPGVPHRVSCLSQMQWGWRRPRRDTQACSLTPTPNPELGSWPHLHLQVLKRPESEALPNTYPVTAQTWLVLRSSVPRGQTAGPLDFLLPQELSEERAVVKPLYSKSTLSSEVSAFPGTSWS